MSQNEEEPRGKEPELVSESQHLQVESSAFEEFKKEQEKFNSKVIGTFLKMRREIDEMQEKQEKIIEEIQQNKEKQNEINVKLYIDRCHVDDNHEDELKYLCGIVIGLKRKQGALMKYVDFKVDLNYQNVSAVEFTIKTLTGKPFELKMNPFETFYEMKKMMTEKAGIPVGRQRLIYEGKQREDHESLEEAGIQNGSVLHLVLRLGGKPCYICLSRSYKV